MISSSALSANLHAPLNPIIVKFAGLVPPALSASAGIQLSLNTLAVPCKFISPSALISV